jgi:hypothetical protein
MENWGVDMGTQKEILRYFRIFSIITHMTEKLNEQPSSEGKWKKRGSEKEPYRARRISHESNTSIEYGEKTWTTAQTVRDLMQNHLDAETGRYFEQIAETIFDETTIKQYLEEETDGEKRKNVDDFLYSAFMYAKHANDMSSDARHLSEKYLKDASDGLLVKNTVKETDSFSPALFLETAKTLVEERPLVSYEVTELLSGKSLGFIPYETLRDEPMYQYDNYHITGMKIVDRGSGFDSQLSSLYITSKTGKRHMRGKYGEGAKMSELHLLRNGATIKMRSAYNIENENGEHRSRVWQTHPKTDEGKLASHGVEIEKEEAEENTGSMVMIRFDKAKGAFQQELLDNIDPRKGGLEKNIADFGENSFSYPMPVTEAHLAGVNTSGDGETQYVQGLRVELAAESFGYQKPWFSYDFLDSSIIAGRDRNEIKNEIVDRIESFWENTDNPELINQLVYTAVHGTKREKATYTAELRALNNILYEGTKKYPLVKEIADRALISELDLREHTPTVIVTSSEESSKDNKKAFSYARKEGYEIKKIEANIGAGSLEQFIKRLPGTFEVFSIYDIERNITEEKTKKEHVERAEGEQEIKLREIFENAVVSVNEFAKKTGMAEQKFTLKFDLSDKQEYGKSKYDNDDDEEDWYGKSDDEEDDEDWYASNRDENEEEEEDLPPVILCGNNVVKIDPNKLSYPLPEYHKTIQKQIEIYLLGGLHKNYNIKDFEETNDKEESEEEEENVEDYENLEKELTDKIKRMEEREEKESGEGWVSGTQSSHNRGWRGSADKDWKNKQDLGITNSPEVKKSMSDMWKEAYDSTEKENVDGISDLKNKYDDFGMNEEEEDFGGYDDYESGEDKESVLKNLQQRLDNLIEENIPEDSSLLATIPDTMEYAKDPAVFSRIIEMMMSAKNSEHEKGKMKYEAYQRALATDLTFSEAQEILKSLGKDSYPVESILKTRIFSDDGKITYYYPDEKAWRTQSLKDMEATAVWHDMPVYTLRDGRLFIPTPVEKGAVLTKGEGKKRSYIFSEGDKFLDLGEYDVKYEDYGNWRKISLHPAGIIVEPEKTKNVWKNISPNEQIQEQLSEYSYFPAGETSSEGTITKGVVSTAIPIEYGQDEWDNPVRVFQDVVQNHLDASREGERVILLFEVDRDNNRAWVSEDELLPSEKIIGVDIKDAGFGYYPSNIATMGASSKKSPLFAGKYGEGQKMVAAAALRNGMDLTYRSVVQGDNAGIQSWTAETVSKPIKVTLGGKEVEKKLVAFDVKPDDASSGETGSSTTLQLPTNATPEQESQWKEWMYAIDPRQKDKRGNGGLSRFVRQLRKPNSERVSIVGSVSVLLDEPGAVYENGLRINASAEAGRSLTFGYDVPEIVTTRERNSYNSDRLIWYAKHALSQITDPSVIEEILRKSVNAEKITKELEIGSIMERSQSASSIWAEVANKVWPGYVVYSREKLSKQMHPENDMFYEIAGHGERKRKDEEVEQASRIFANLVHLDKNKLLNVSEHDYNGFSRLFPTAESIIQKMETETVPLSPAIKKNLCELLAESAKECVEMMKNEEPNFSSYQKERIYEKAEEWNDSNKIEEKNGVAVSVMDSAFHGKAGREVVFNEELLLSGDRRQLAHVALHEMTHILSGYGDYSEEFVLLLYGLAQHLAEKKEENKT